VADRAGFFKEAGLDCKLIQGGSGVKTREIVASSQGDIGIGDITHPMQLSNHGRAGRVLMPVDTRSSAVMFIIRKDLSDQGIKSLETLAEWKRPDGRKPIVSVSSLGGTNHVWASYYMETMGLDQKVTWIGTGNVDTNPTPDMASEDFAFMLQKKPGCYVWLGAGHGDGTPNLHNPRYDFNDEVLAIGASYWVRLAEQELPVTA